VGFEAERELAEAALAHKGPDPRPEFPSSKHLTAARERAGLSERQFAQRFGSDGYLCPDLETHNGEIFECESVTDLIRIASILGTSVSVILLGEEPAVPLPDTPPEQVAHRLRERIQTEGSTADQLGDALGWRIEPVLEDPAALLTYNLDGLYDICSGVGVDWLAVVATCERGRRTTRCS
jgi:transcriptional regulator with XRE-family HTH domain